jgi:peptide/nickel transport system permease protein
MTTADEVIQPKATPEKRAGSSTLARVAKYTALRLATLFVTVVVGVYLTIMIANMGGHVDRIMRGEIQERVTIQVVMNPANRGLSPAQRNELVRERIAIEESRWGWINRLRFVHSITCATR